MYVLYVNGKKKKRARKEKQNQNQNMVEGKNKKGKLPHAHPHLRHRGTGNLIINRIGLDEPCLGTIPPAAVAPRLGRLRIIDSEYVYI